MKNRILQMKKVLNVALFILLMSTVGMTKMDAQNILFADDNVKALCVANWDTNGDNELSYAEAAAVTDLGEVFKNNTNITSFDELQYFIGLTSIGDHAFYYCSALTSIILPNFVTTIDSNAFYYCYHLTSIVIPNSVTSIGDRAFFICSGLTSVSIGNSVTFIGDFGFASCRGLTSLIVRAENPPTLGSNVFNNVYKTIPLYVPCASSQIYQNAEGWNEFANRVEMCPGVITVTVNSAEYGTVTGGGSYEGGETCTVTATPNEGYFFAYWSENGEEISNKETYSFTVAGDRALVANFVSDGIIAFADATVKALCVDNWDTDGDGELSYAEADAVTDLGSVFKNNNNITAFDELQYFTGLTFIGNDAFSYCRNLTSIIIPNFVTSFGTYAFRNCSSLTSVTIPNSVTSIAGCVFEKCSSLMSITIPNSVITIGYDAFRDCTSLTSLSIGNSLASIGNEAFSGCIALEQIVVASGNPVYDSRNNCNAIIKTSTNKLFAGCKNTVIPNTVTSIGESAFEDCSSLISITIPSSVTSIENYAFSGCSGMTLIAIPSSVTSIGNYVLNGCSGLGQIVVASGNTVYDSRNNCNAIIKTNTNELVAGCKNTVIPTTVTSIGLFAFYGCSTLTSISIPNSVTSFGNYAFGRCENLTSITIPNSVTNIGRSAFYSCTGLTSVSIGSSVTSIEEQAFYYCNSLASVLAWPETPPTLGSYVFGYVDKSIPLYVACASFEAYRNATGWSDFNNCFEMCPGVITVTANVADYGIVSGGGSFEGGETCTVTAIPNDGCVFSYWSENGAGVSNEQTYSFIVAGDRTLVANFVSDDIIVFADDNVKAICVAHWDTNGDGELGYAEANAVTNLGTVFRYKTNITSFNELQYFTGLTSIGYEAFYGCSGLTSVVIPNSVTSIEQYAFCSCSDLTSITIPGSVTSLGKDSFSYCYVLTTVDISNSMNSIGESAFEFCHALTSITIPNSVSSIGSRAFSCCESLEQIVVDAGNPVYDSRNNCNAIIRTSTNVLVVGCKNTVIPNTVTSIGQDAFSGCEGLTSFSIPSSVTSIGNSAFYHCIGLTSVNIPNTLTSIGSGAFSGCTGLTSVSIGSSVTSIGTSAFGNCSAIEQITVVSDNEVYDSREDCDAIINTSTNQLIAGCKNTVIPNSVTSIGSYAFYYCGSLTSITIPESVTSIGSYAFRSCSDLTLLVIGNSVATIGSYAFDGCNHLALIKVWAENPPTLGSSAISGISRYTPLYVPCGFYEAYQNATGWNEFFNCFEMCPGVITVTANPAEYGTVSGGGSFEGGETCTVTATPNEGFLFTYWSENGGGVSNEETYSFTVAGDRALVANFISDGNIVFADDNVKALCVANWDTNGDGELSYAEANAVTSLGEVFKGKNNITTFDELQYFTGLTSIVQYAFSNCSALTSVVIPNSVASIKYYAFQQCTALTSVVIPNSVVTIENSAFIRCSGMTSITIPNSVNTIGSTAFYNCTGLTSVTIPNSVTSIEREAFGFCNSLTSITIPSSVVSIGSNPVIGCVGLEQIVVEAENTVFDSRNNCNAIIKTSTNELISGCKNTLILNSVTTIGSGAFYGCTGLTLIDIPNSVTNIETSAFYNCTGLTSVDIPNSVINIRSSAFYKCAGLTSVSIGNSVAYFGSDVFGYCSALGQIIVASDNELFDSRENCNAIIKTSTNELIVGCMNTVIPNSVISIGRSAFGNCNGLTSIIIPNSVTSIGEDAFEQCSNLTSIVIPNSVTTIGQYAFYYCSAMASVTIGNSVASIGKNAFYSCRGLTSMTVLAETPPTLGNDVFRFVTKSIPVYVPCGFSDVYQDATDWNEFTNYIGLCEYTITAMTDPIEGGSVTGAGTYIAGETCTLTAIANAGYAFNNWTENGEIVSTDAAYSFIVESDRTLVANFINSQTRLLATGWNWWSTYIEQEGINGLTMLENSLGENGLTIKSQYAFVEYDDQTDTWTGGLSSIENAFGYKVMVSQACTSVMNGDLTAPESHPTTLIPGWTWTGYPVTVAQTVTTALSDFTPMSGDIIKGQDAYASYDVGLGWTPASFVLNPGECYMYYSNATTVRNLVFSQSRGEVPQTDYEGLYWQADRHIYANNLTMMATVTVDGEEQRGEDIELGAFVNGECRGSAKLYYVEPLDRYIAFLTVTGQDDEEVEFKLMNPVRDVTFTSEDRITFRSDAIVGHLDQPFTIHFGTMNGLSDMSTNMHIYPNPIDRNMSFTLAVPEDEVVVDILITNALGEIVRHDAGSLSATMTAGLPVSGVYLVKVTCKSGRVYQNRLIVR